MSEEQQNKDLLENKEIKKTREMKNLDLLIQNKNEAEKAFLARKDKQGEKLSQAHSNLAAYYAEQENYKGSIENYKQAIAFYEGLDSKRHGSYHSNLAQAYENNNQTHTAIDSYKKAIHYYKQAGDGYAQAQNFNSIAQLHVSLGEYELAWENSNQAVAALCSGEGDFTQADLHLLTKSYLLSGHTADILKKTQTATNSYQHAIDLYAACETLSPQENTQMGECHRCLAKLNDNSAEAEQLYLEAIKWFEKSDNHEYLVESYEELAAVLKKQGKDEAALQNIQKAKALLVEQSPNRQLAVIYAKEAVYQADLGDHKQTFTSARLCMSEMQKLSTLERPIAYPVLVNTCNQLQNITSTTSLLSTSIYKLATVSLSEQISGEPHPALYFAQLFDRLSSPVPENIKDNIDDFLMLTDIILNEYNKEAFPNKSLQAYLRNEKNRADFIEKIEAVKKHHHSLQGDIFPDFVLKTTQHIQRLTQENKHLQTECQHLTLKLAEFNQRYQQQTGNNKKRGRETPFWEKSSESSTTHRHHAEQDKENRNKTNPPPLVKKQALTQRNSLLVTK